MSPPATERQATSPKADHAPKLLQLTPVLVVESVEPCLPFWEDRLGFRRENEVPGPDGQLLFASVSNDVIEIMYQTRSSELSEEPEQTREARALELQGHSVVLFIHVDDIDAVERAVAGSRVVKARHQTPYGTTELYVEEPGGNVVGFSMHAPSTPALDDR
jgi:uncharacterized glyoxalase superfamily protein PhnB